MTAIDQTTQADHAADPSNMEIFVKKSAIFWWEAPQTGFETARGLENLTPRGHCINKNKNQILF